MKTKNNFYKANFLVERRNDVHTVMVKMPPVKSIVDYISQIPNDVIYDDESKDYGKTKPESLHITVLYGINKDEGGRVKKSLVNIPPNISATLGEVTMFECEKYDVLKIDVTSSHLSKINKFLRRNFNYTNDYDDYKPHVTLCYVKKGMGKNYIGDKRFNGLNYNFSIFIYSDEHWNKTNMKMEGKKKINEVGLGLGGGYGGAPGGGVSARGWAGTFTSPMTSTRLGNYPLKMVHRDKAGAGNTIANMDPYDSVNDKDLEHPVFKPDEIRSGVRYEMTRMEYPSKDIAKQIVLTNLKKDSKYYSDLHQYFETQQNESKLTDPKAGLTDDMVGRWTIKTFTEEHPLKNIKKENTNMKTTPEQEMKIGIQIELMDIEDEPLATKIANDNLTVDPQHYSKLIASGLVIDKNAFNKTVGHPEQKSATTPNTIDVGATPRKQPEQSAVACNSLINRTTGAPMPNTIKTDMGTVPMAGATQPVSQDATAAEADPTDFYLSKMRGV